MKLFSFSKPKTLSSRLEWSLVIATLVGFTAIVFATIANSSIWFDEAFGAYMIKFSFLDIFKYTSLDVHPPLYYWLLKLWGMVFGTSDVALRSMSVFFAIVALIIGYLFIRRLFGQRVALITIPLVALSPILVRYAQEMRMYTLVLAIGIAATYTLYTLRDKPTRGRWALYGILVALGMWTHYFTALIWLSHWVWRAIETYRKPFAAWRKSFFTKQWVLVHVWAVALFLPWLPWLVRQVLDVQTNGFWIPPISPITIPSYLSDIFLYETAEHTLPWLTILLAALTAAGAYLIVRTYKTMKSEDRSKYRLLLVVAIAPVLLLIAMSLPPLQSTFIDRYLLTAAVMLVMALGVAIALLPRSFRRLQFAIVCLIILSSIIGITNVYHYGNYNVVTNQKSETKQLIQLIQATPGTSGQPIIANTPWIYYEAAQYSTGANEVYFINQYVEYKFGSLEMLRQSDRGKITDLDAFLRANPIIWYIGRPGSGEIDPPAGNVQVLQRIRINDSITSQPAYEAVQYQLIAE